MNSIISKEYIVTNIIQRYLHNDGIYNQENYDLVRLGLLKYSQRETNNYVFSEMLIWFFMKNKQYRMAFLQAKAFLGFKQTSGFYGIQEFRILRAQKRC